MKEKFLPGKDFDKKKVSVEKIQDPICAVFFFFRFLESSEVEVILPSFILSKVI